MVQLSHLYMTTGKTIALTRWIFVGKVMSLLLNMLSRFVIAFLSGSKFLLISWLQSPAAVILEPKKIVCHCFHCVYHRVYIYIYQHIRIARRDKKAFLSDQCKETEENSRMGKPRDFFKKIRDTKGTFHSRMGTIKDRNAMDLTEAEDIKRRWQEYTEELYKKDLHDPDNHDGMITHLEPDILECEVKWALGSITMNKASGGDGIPVELYQILKDDSVKVLHLICQQIWKT